MASYLDRWKTIFLEVVGTETRPTDGIDNSLDFNTDGFPQRIASDPVHYSLENALGEQLFSNDQRLKELISNAILAAHPIGSLYFSSNSTDPTEIFGGGTWARIKDKFILAAGDTYTAGTTGGEATHILSAAEMPSHNHNFGGTTSNVNISGGLNVRANDPNTWGVFSVIASGIRSEGNADDNDRDRTIGFNSDHTHTFSGTTASSGSNAAHNNMPPYEVYYCWKRTS